MRVDGKGLMVDGIEGLLLLLICFCFFVCFSVLCEYCFFLIGVVEVDGGVIGGCMLDVFLIGFCLNIVGFFLFGMWML